MDVDVPSLVRCAKRESGVVWQTNNRTATITHFTTGKGVTSAAVRWRDIQVGTYSLSHSMSRGRSVLVHEQPLTLCPEGGQSWSRDEGDLWALGLEPPRVDIVHARSRAPACVHPACAMLDCEALACPPLCAWQVGDLIRVSNKQPLPADVVVLATGEDDNVCYIETSSIDGETNLKLRRYRTHTYTHTHTDQDQGKMYHLVVV